MELVLEREFLLLQKSLVVIAITGCVVYRVESAEGNSVIFVHNSWRLWQRIYDKRLGYIEKEREADDKFVARIVS